MNLVMTAIVALALLSTVMFILIQGGETLVKRKLGS